MERKDFILILTAIIIISGSYYFYTNSIWPFTNSNNQPELISPEISSHVYAVSGVVKEIYDTIIIIETDKPKSEGGFGELMAVINPDTSIFKFNAVSPDQIDYIPLSLEDIFIGDYVALTSDDDITSKKNGVFLASSIAVN